MDGLIDIAVMTRLEYARAFVWLATDMLVLERDVDQVRQEQQMRLLEELADGVRRVRGNRPGNQGMTWADGRLLLEGTLRHCLKRLENP